MSGVTLIHLITEPGRCPKVAFLACDTSFLIETQTALGEPYRVPEKVNPVFADSPDFAKTITAWQERGKQLISERKIVAWRIIQKAETVHSTGVSTLPAPFVPPQVQPQPGHVPAAPK